MTTTAWHWTSNISKSWASRARTLDSNSRNKPRNPSSSTWDNNSSRYRRLFRVVKPTGWSRTPAVLATTEMARVAAITTWSNSFSNRYSSNRYYSQSCNSRRVRLIAPRRNSCRSTTTITSSFCTTAQALKAIHFKCRGTNSLLTTKKRRQRLINNSRCSRQQVKIKLKRRIKVIIASTSSRLQCRQAPAIASFRTTSSALGFKASNSSWQMAVKVRSNKITTIDSRTPRLVLRSHPQPNSISWNAWSPQASLVLRAPVMEIKITPSFCTRSHTGETPRTIGTISWMWPRLRTVSIWSTLEAMRMRTWTLKM